MLQNHDLGITSMFGEPDQTDWVSMTYYEPATPGTPQQHQNMASGEWYWSFVALFWLRNEH